MIIKLNSYNVIKQMGKKNTKPGESHIHNQESD